MTTTTTKFAWTLCDRLVKSRKVAGLTGIEMADRLGITRQTVTNWEAGHTNPRRTDLIVWAQITGAPLEWLIEGDERPLDDADHIIDRPTRAFRWKVIQFAAAA